ncbi:D-dopachrome decarboxylase [Mizuhopecten yessoensis]|uniref:D-dopachrome decarboxylase n=2 Tax=Mizuhopecten yessoensis TaxID=6573 RepID=A0A210Q6H4_MIZYE|nr:D-dopachrome decarboxylase [Mizuhopecten yessoensis]
MTHQIWEYYSPKPLPQQHPRIMPTVMCYTNLEKDQLPEDFERWATALVAEVLDNPAKFVSVIVVPGARMLRLEDPSPMMLVQVHAIGVFDKERNPGYTQKFNQSFREKLDLPAKRIPGQLLYERRTRHYNKQTNKHARKLLRNHNILLSRDTRLHISPPHSKLAPTAVNMPFIMCYTNLSKDKLPDGFVKWISELVSDVLTKPMERITTTVSTDLEMMRMGSSDPTMLIQIHSIGVFDADRNPGYTEKLNKAIHEKLELPANRVALQYLPVDKVMVGNVP